MNSSTLQHEGENVSHDVASVQRSLEFKGPELSAAERRWKEKRSATPSATKGGLVAILWLPTKWSVTGTVSCTCTYDVDSDAMLPIGQLEKRLLTPRENGDARWDFPPFELYAKSVHHVRVSWLAPWHQTIYLILIFFVEDSWNKEWKRYVWFVQYSKVQYYYGLWVCVHLVSCKYIRSSCATRWYVRLRLLSHAYSHFLHRHTRTLFLIKRCNMLFSKFGLPIHQLVRFSLVYFSSLVERICEWCLHSYFFWVFKGISLLLTLTSSPPVLPLAFAYLPPKHTPCPSYSSFFWQSLSSLCEIASALGVQALSWPGMPSECKADICK